VKVTTAFYQAKFFVLENYACTNLWRNIEITFRVT